MSHFLRRHSLARALAAVAGVVAGVSVLASSAIAHPHVYVTAATTINIEQGAITSFDHVWAFDEMYTAMAIEGLDTNKDGKYDKSELAELAKVNVEGLKEFKYFTQVMLGNVEQAFVDPKPEEFWLEVNKGVLSMHFRVGLLKPVLVDAKDFALTVSDPSFFIAIGLEEKDPVKLNASAPKTCKAVINAEADGGTDSKALGDAFSKQLGGVGSSPGGSAGGGQYGFLTTKVIRVQC
jgi:ABC-type uncharacterized transport system substrate-binding protein